MSVANALLEKYKWKQDSYPESDHSETTTDRAEIQTFHLLKVCIYHLFAGPTGRSQIEQITQTQVREDIPAKIKNLTKIM